MSADSSSAEEEYLSREPTGSAQSEGKRREAFIALIAPIGINLDQVVDALSQALGTIKYRTNPIHLTDIFRENEHWYDIKYSNEVERYEQYIKAGDELCKESGRKDVLALYGIARLYNSPRGGLDDLPSGVVHIFRQIKRVEEIAALNEVYGRNVLFVSCYAPQNDRGDNLVNKMLKTERGTTKTKLKSHALEIIAKDEEEREDPFGQRIVECYPKANYVLDCSNHACLVRSANRFVEIFFGAPFVSPNRDEYASYLANAASYRSLDLSRQVGAAIFGKDGEVVSLGCNEVPRAGGGTYWGDDDHDFRDYAVGYDSNQKVREDMASDALLSLKKKGWLAADIAQLHPDDMVRLAFCEGVAPGPWTQSMIKDVIEFGRMVHAEMNALADAARFRRSTAGTTLYCTTMPCHMCTKLIIAAGVERVVYLQPYSKSLVEELYPDSVAIDEHPKAKRVVFETLKGVTPNGFKRAFHKRDKRKNDDGTAKQWDPTHAVPTFSSTFPYYLPLETRAIELLEEGLAKVKQRHPKQHDLGVSPVARQPHDGGSTAKSPKKKK